MESTRINKYLSERGVCSRREADRAIDDGDVIINGKPAVLGQVVNSGDEVRFRGRIVQKQRRNAIYLALNKPVGIISTTDRNDPDNIVDFVNYSERIFPVGRLDRDSEGLILMTNDGDIVNRILRQQYGHEKEYAVTVDRTFDEEFMRQMREGVPILDTVTKPAKIRRTGARSFRLVITQGLNRQIRRMCEALGYEVVNLQRVRIMNVTLGNLKPGEYRHIGRLEMEQMRTLLEQAEKKAVERGFDDF